LAGKSRPLPKDYMQPEPIRLRSMLLGCQAGCM